MMSTLTRAALSLVVTLVLTLPTSAQDTPPAGSASTVGLEKPVMTNGGGRIPVRIVGGRLIVAVDLSSPSRRIPANLFVEYDGAFGLQLHNQAAGALRIETGDGRAIPITIHFPEFTVIAPRREIGDQDDLEHFTKYYSAEMDENAVVGAIGAEVLKHFGIVFDLSRGLIELEPLGALAGQTTGLVGEKVTTPIHVDNDLAWLPVQLEDGERAGLAVGSSRYDTVVDEVLCDDYDAPAGNLGPLTCGGLDLAPYVAFRPEEVIQVHPDRVAGVIGLNILERFRIRVDRDSGMATLEPTRPAEFPDADLAFFEARVEELADPIEAWLEAHPGERLAHEASELLLTLRIEEGAEQEDAARATKWIHDTMVEDLRTTRMLDLMDEMSNEGLDELVVAAGRIGIESGRDDRYPDAVHKVHGRLGEVLLDRGEDRDAWRHLLSAAFGLPDDGVINLNLGRYYERAGQPRRAFSRYIQAVIQEDSAPRAMEGMERLDQNAPAEERLSVDLVERMIAGKVYNFGAATKYEPTEEATNRTALVEFFTNAFIGDDRAGAIGGALGNQGVMSHFDSNYCVFLSYHLPQPRLDPLVNELAVRTAGRLGVAQPTVQVINGTTQGPGAARRRQAEAVYEMVRDEVKYSLEEASPFDLILDVDVEDRDVVGELTVLGAERENTTVEVIVAERGAIFPGSSTIVIHRMLARGSALDTLDGVPLAVSDGRMSLPFRRSLDDIERENAAYLDQLEADGAGAVSRMGLRIDPNAVIVVAIVRDASSGEVLQAASAEPPDEEAAP